MAVKPGSNSFYEISSILASFANSNDFFPEAPPIMGYTGRGGFAFTAAPEMLPTPTWSPTFKWSPIRPRNDTDPEMIPVSLHVDPEMIPN